ncbi:MAG: hypothetical protein Q4A86_00275 [Clostridia bacterium]|nr:hypothetical protein [Clostridia bacterium]
MKGYEKFLWSAFENTGSVRDYLKFKLFEEERMKIEAGEEFGFDKNIGNSAEDNQVR